MAIRKDAPANGSPIWVELSSSDLDTSISFYAELLGWQVTVSGPELGGYAEASKDGHRVAGLGPNRSKETGPANPDGWTVYLATDDIEGVVARAKDAGGQVIQKPMQIGGLGSMALVADPSTAVFGLWQPDTHYGTELLEEPGGVAWHELYTRSFAASKGFYAEVFGAGYKTVGDTDDFRYAELQIEGRTVAGVMDVDSFFPVGVPSYWGVYFSVTDCQATFDRAVELGASPIMDVERTPFGVIGQFIDPTGAQVKLHQRISEDGSSQ